MNVWVKGKRPQTMTHDLQRVAHQSAQAFGESWAGTSTGVCNSYAYTFADVSLLGADRRPAGPSVTAVHDPSYAIVRLSQTSFVARSA